MTPTYSCIHILELSSSVLLDGSVHAKISICYRARGHLRAISARGTPHTAHRGPCMHVSTYIYAVSVSLSIGGMHACMHGKWHTIHSRDTHRLAGMISLHARPRPSPQQLASVCKCMRADICIDRSQYLLYSMCSCCYIRCIMWFVSIMHACTWISKQLVLHLLRLMNSYSRIMS
jgi:hypothetical protein